MTIAAARPTRRAFDCCACGSLELRIEMKMTLSTPRTISRKVSVTRASSPSAVRIASMRDIVCGFADRAMASMTVLAN